MIYSNVYIQWVYADKRGIHLGPNIIARIVNHFNLGEFGNNRDGSAKVGCVGDDISDPLAAVTEAMPEILIIVTGTSDAYGLDEHFREYYFKGSSYDADVKTFITPPDNLPSELDWVATEEI